VGVNKKRPLPKEPPFWPKKGASLPKREKEKQKKRKEKIPFPPPLFKNASP